MTSVPAEPANREVMHIDMDAFYASVESHDDPALAGRPLIVGGTGVRGVVASCSYEARAFGVRSAMPTGQARRLCPQAVFVAGRYDRYNEISGQIHAIFQDYTPLVEGISLDEAFLEITGATRLFGPAITIARSIRQRVAGELGLGCSVGIAPSKFLAKLASQAAKPLTSANPARPMPRPGPGMVIVAPGHELAFLHPMAVQALWGVGPATLARLSTLGVTTVGDLASIPLATLEARVGRAHGRHLHDLARARDNRAVEPDRRTKSIGHEETYAYDRFERAELEAEVVRMADAVAARLHRAGLAGRTINLKVRYGDFRTITRAKTLPQPTNAGPVIAKVAAGILATVDLSPGVRLFGMSASNLTGPGERAGEQMELALGDAESDGRSRTGPGDADRALAWAAASNALSAVRLRYGDNAIGPAALLDGDGLRLKRQGDTQWGPSGGDDRPLG